MYHYNIYTNPKFTLSLSGWRWARVTTMKKSAASILGFLVHQPVKSNAPLNTIQ